MTPEELSKVIADTRRRIGAGHDANHVVVEDICQEAERLVERVRELESIVSQSPTERCMEEQANGSGGCGACAGCCHELRGKVEELETELRVSQLRARSAEGIAGLTRRRQGDIQ